MSDLPEGTAERVFNCAVCGDLFVTFTSEAEMNRELLDSGMDTEDQGLHSVCDDCYEVVMAKAREQGIVP